LALALDPKRHKAGDRPADAGPDGGCGADDDGQRQVRDCEDEHAIRREGMA
jgi:hypothetical protein